MGVIAEKIAVFCLTQPVIRSFLLTVFVKVWGDLFSDIFHRSEADPVFRAALLVQTNRLKNATTDEERQDAMAKIDALHAGTSSK
jgi:hypothetical protein